ncbi:hypothetical protein FDECE_2640 [Fusarium decemcellulare]|nr:hypothetical protein FDECE_2640 [Fusarium decemcellulare]
MNHPRADGWARLLASPCSSHSGPATTGNSTGINAGSDTSPFAPHSSMSGTSVHSTPGLFHFRSRVTNSQPRKNASRSQLAPRDYRRTRSFSASSEARVFGRTSDSLRMNTSDSPPMDMGHIASCEEQDHYYDGLPSRPRLLARSGAKAWSRPLSWDSGYGYEKKRLDHVGRHPVVEE